MWQAGAMKHDRYHFAVATALLAACAAFAACGDDSTDSNAGSTSSSSTSSGSGGGGGAGDGGAANGGGGAGGAVDPPEPSTRATVSGDITWQVTFDATAQGAGATDCSYTRHYEGVEDRSAPWLCPTCEAMFRADVEVTAGRQDCYAQVSSSDPAPVEWIG
jgi:hypothetical protein